MKKPTIESRPAKGFEQMGKHFWVNERALTPDEIKIRYDAMIDALIMLYKYAKENQPNYLLTSKYISMYEIEQALINAGVEL